MKIVTVIGARPQFIKAANVSRVIRDIDGIIEVIVHTGQHYDDNMSDIFFKELDIPEPDYNLGIGGQYHGQMTGRQLESVEKVLLQEKPDWVLVYGDTNSTLAGALAAAKLHIPVAHVEAGLRSFNRKMPEEINRVLTDHVSDLLFAPTQTAVKNLADENIKGDNVQLIGDVMFDAAVFYGKKCQKRKKLLDKYAITSKKYILATIHRPENTDDGRRIRKIIEGLVNITNELPVVFPLHPRTRKALEKIGLFSRAKNNLILIDPLGYLDMVMFEKNAAAIITDSGGVQKEAYFHQIPCITLRDETEWRELIDPGYNKLINVIKSNIFDAVIQQLNRNHIWYDGIYGDAKAAFRVVSGLKKQMK